MESGYASVEPEAGCCGEVGGVGVQFEEDSDVVAAGLVDEVVEIVEGSEGGVDGLGVGGVWLEGGQEKGVGSEGVDVVEALGQTLYVVEAARVGLVDDGVPPPRAGAHTGADPAGTGQGLGEGGRGEEKSQEEGAAGGHGRVSVSGVVEMVADFFALVEVVFLLGFL